MSNPTLENFADAWDAGFRTLLLNLHGDASHTPMRNPFDPDRPCPCREDHGYQPSVSRARPVVEGDNQ